MVAKGGATALTSVLGMSSGPGGRTDREQALRFSGSWGAAPILPTATHTHTRWLPLVRAHSFTTPTPQAGNQSLWVPAPPWRFPAPLWPWLSHLCNEGFELVISQGPLCPDMLALTFSSLTRRTGIEDHPPPLPKQGSTETHRRKQTDTHAEISRNRGRAKTHRHWDSSRSRDPQP